MILFKTTPCVRLLYHYKTGLSQGLLTGVLGLIYVCIYVFLRETTSLCNPLVICFWREITLSWHSYFLFIIYIFHLEVTCSHHVLHLWSRGKRSKQRKLLLYDLVCKEKQLHYEHYFYCVFINTKGNEHVTKPFYNYLL